jgi:phosphoglycolate phosphatase
LRALLLFDIDGTLLTGGPAKGAFHRAMLAVYGTAGPIDTHSFGGKTDPQIARELLLADGFEADAIDDGLPKLFDHYLAELERNLVQLPMVTLPGVEELLSHLGKRDDVGLGLVTGNVQRGAHLKLESASISPDFFPVGAFGSDHEERNELPGFAIDRACESLGFDPSVGPAVIIGDTPKDVECGRAHGTRTVAVATGKVSMDRLRLSEPDALLESFEDLDRTLEALIPGG